MFGAEGFDDVSRFCWLVYILLVNAREGGVEEEIEYGTGEMWDG